MPSPAGPRLIVVAGCMRSGTTLLQRLLCTSADTGPALPADRWLADQLRLAERYARRDSLFVEEQFGGVAPFESFSRDIVERYLRQVWEATDRPSALVVKGAELTGALPILARWFPDARFVVSVRDPRDTVASMLRVGQRQRRFRLRSVVAESGRDMIRLSAVYRGAYLPLLRRLRRDRDLAARVRFVRYEDLVADPGAEAAALGAFCGVAVPDGGVASLPRSQGLARVAAHPHWRSYLTALSERPVSRKSVGTHARILSDEEVRMVQKRCRRLMKHFEYI